MLTHYDELRLLLEKDKPHIIGINETKLDQSTHDCDLIISNYNIIRKDRDKYGGGVLMYIHNSLDFKLRDDLDFNLESVSIEIKVGNFKPFLVTSLYRSPHKPVEYFGQIESLISATDCDGKESIIIGDTNCDFSTDSNNDTKNLKRILNTYGFKQIIKEPTRTTSDTKTIIDHIITNKTEYVSNSGIIHCGISDHDAVFMQKNMRIPKLKLAPKTISVRNYKHFDKAAFLSDLRMAHFDEIKNYTNDANEMWSLWKRLFTDILNKHAPINNLRIKGTNVPYITSDLKHMIRQRDYLKSKAVKTGSKLLYQAFLQVKSRVFFKLNKLRRDYYAKKIDETKGDMKKTWKVLKNAMNQDPKTNTIQKVTYIDKEITDPSKIAEACNDHFASIGKKLAENIIETDSNPTQLLKQAKTKFKFECVQVDQVIKVMRNLANAKAVGVHSIPNRSLKEANEVIAPSLCDIFNYAIDTKTYPVDLNIAKTTPIFKTGDKEDLNNYRPISIIPTVARIFERLIYNQIYSYLSVNNLLSTKQYGFRTLHSTALALSESTNHWLLNMGNGKMNSVIFLDIKKAFDTVNHDILLDKMSFYGIKGGELDFFKSYLSNRVQCCNVNGSMSGFKQITCGVPQGSILGPLLFLLYMNDLPDAIENTNVTMFADDTSLSKPFKSINELNDELIPAFVKICKWLKANKLSLNTVKTEFMIIGTLQRIEKLDISLETTPYALFVDNSHIRRVKQVKNLGLIIDEHLSWSQHIDYISVKLKRNVGILKRMSKTLPTESLIMLYKTLIEPHIRYCSVVWGNCGEVLKDKLQIFQNRAARIITKTPFDNADHFALLQKLQWLSVRDIINHETGVHMFKAVNHLMPKQINDFFIPLASQHSYQTRSMTYGNLYMPTSQLSIEQRALNYKGSKLWNEIPPEIRNAPSLNSFKIKYKNYLIKKDIPDFQTAS